MTDNGRKPLVLLADDDENVAFLMKMVFKQTGISCDLATVKDGEEVLDYLLRRNQFEGREEAMPRVILLDMNMPRKDGREALAEMRAREAFRFIPVVVFSISRAERDLRAAYELGANAYVRKPIGYREFSDLIQVVLKYWLYIVEPPAVVRVRAS